MIRTQFSATPSTTPISGQDSVWRALLLASRKRELVHRLASRRLLALIAISICVLVSGWAVVPKARRLSSLASSTSSIDADNLDRSLQRAATLALGPLFSDLSEE